ncbi:NAD-dependent epimerase/dehydratase family protein [Endomicrobium proavitum]|uniref:NAD-dependent epimerase/dehydratase n=1 Tax=Endomicrobium proavitum TaxID=1408281 RepID=A0A0G3WGB9_9BACT|nr:NAD-dependent epimerase/dehydratase family protein [Endomicrobium proavitum]AKL97706.1 NAD-dependent epimerase/dehydratase [Endomicrobium proavitum]
MKIILTGATGFLGSALLAALLEKKHNVIILKRSHSNVSKIKNLLKKIKSIDVDKTDVCEIFKKNKNIDAVIHVATNYGKKNEKLTDIFKSNVLFPLELLDNAAKNKVPHFINTSSFFQKITDANHPLYAYIKTKQEFLSWGKYYAQTGKINFTDANIFHLYGAGDCEETKFIPYIIKQCSGNVKYLDMTSGEQKRDFIFLDDAVEAYLKILNKKNSGFTKYEIGSGKQITIKQACEIIKKISKSKIKFNFGKIPYRNGEVMNAKANLHLNKNIHWKAKTSFSAGILKIISAAGGK